MYHEVLIDPFNTVFAVNCQVEGAALHCGALYLEPLVQGKLIRLSYGSASLNIELPPELVGQPTPQVAWNISLPLQDEQVRQPSLFA